MHVKIKTAVNYYKFFDLINAALMSMFYINAELHLKLV